MESFRNWLELVDSGPFDTTTSTPDRLPWLIRGGGEGDKKVPKPMRPEPTTSAFQTYGGPALPDIKRKQLARTI